MRHIRSTFMAAFLCTMAMHSSAERRVDHLYEARIPIADRSAVAQELAMQKGLATVLNKISGYSQTSEFPELESGLSSASQLVSEFAIQTMEAAAEDELTVRLIDALYMRFINDGVDQLIRQFEIPVWPATRPEILVLVAIELAGQVQLLTRETHPAAYAVLNKVAFDRGITLIFLDETVLDDLSISASSVWNLDEDLLKSTFTLPPADNIAVIRLYKGIDSSNYGDINLLEPAGFSSRLDGQNQLESLTSGLHRYLDELSLGTAFVASSVADTRLLLQVQGVPNFAAFIRVRDYVQSLEQIENAKLLRLGTESYVMQLEFQSGIELLRSSLSSSGFLVESDASSPGLSGSSQITYRYIMPLEFPVNRTQQ